VPCLVIDEVGWKLRIGGGIEDVAPTVLQLMGLPQPEAMQGKSILLKPAQK
jgi:2,3-bisphosphoglycerate-independent phosphoglycerate mutase